MGRPKKEGGMSATDYKRDFNEKNYDRLSPYVKRGKKDRYKEAAKAAGYSLNEFMEKPWTNWQRRSWENKKHKPPALCASGAFRRLPSRVFNIFRC